MNVIRLSLRCASLVPAFALLVGQASFSHAQTVLIDFGSDTSYRGLSVNNPAANGIHWNSLQPGLLVENLKDVAGVATTIDLGWDTPVATDSYNGPAGITDEATLETDVQFADVDVDALGNLGTSLEGVFDFAAGYDGIQHFTVRFQLQGLNPAATYNLTFFGSHAFSDDTTTVYTVYSDDTYTTAVDTVSLDVQDPVMFWMHNRDEVATITGVSPQADDILYVEFVGDTGRGGYLNALQIEAAAAPLVGDYNNDGSVNGLDLSVWEDEFGDAGPGLAADGDGDGDADGADFLLWQQHVGQPSPANPLVDAVPEPAGAALLLTGLTALPAASRRRKHRPES
jgi:hypothetical protein